MPTETITAISARQREIVKQYIAELDKHIADLKNGNAESTYEIRDLAEILHIHPRHLSNTIRRVLGKSACALYEERLMSISRELLANTDLPIAQIANRLTYDPSNFTKFFKHFEGMTPKKFRQSRIKN